MELVINIYALENRYGISKAIDICKEAGFTAMDYSLSGLCKDESVWNSDDYRAAAQEIRNIADEKGFL